MTKDQFLQTLKEDKFIEDLDKVIEHRLPVVQYFLSNYTNAVISNGHHTISSRLITIVYNKDTDFQLVNYAYNCILNLYKNGSLQ